MSVDTPTIEDLPVEEIDTGLCSLRITRPGEVDKMRRAMESMGQLTPIMVRYEQNTYQLLDGFKRYYAAEKLGWPTLQAMIVEMSVSRGKAMILRYNRETRRLGDYDQALIVHSLKSQDLLDQSAIARLTGYSRSWVCRRLALIERLCEQVRQALRMGSITCSQARCLVKLPRGNQAGVMQVVIAHHMSSRATAILVEQYLRSKTDAEQRRILSEPMQVIEQACRPPDDIHDTRLGFHGNRLLKTMEHLGLQQNIFISQAGHRLTSQLNGSEKDLLGTRMARLEQGARQTLTIIQQRGEL